MDRGVLLSVITALSLALGCGRSAQEQAPKPAETAPPPPPAATVATPPPTTPGPKSTPPAYRKSNSEIALIKIGLDGKPDPETLELDDFNGKQTVVVWVADCAAEKLDVTFKTECDGYPKPGNIKDPPCTDIACAIDAKRIDTKKTIHLCYNVILKLPGQPTPITIDPKLIINP